MTTYVADDQPPSPTYSNSPKRYITHHRAHSTYSHCITPNGSVSPRRQSPSSPASPPSSSNDVYTSSHPIRPTLPSLSQVLVHVLNARESSGPFILPLPRGISSTTNPTLPPSPTASITRASKFQIHVPTGPSSTIPSHYSSKSRDFKVSFHQLALLKREFSNTKHPTSSDYDRISAVLNIPRKFVLTWFRHRRAKDRQQSETQIKKRQ
ncbi:hypothetical protein BDR26DRAFT_850716 [Obelidium mucronatum]|nr:hypothetical protein BDR26DRAFT_850716 [Obelidium mucronatum]